MLCSVHGRQYLHLIKAKRGEQYQIGNNHGRINGWTDIIYGGEQSAMICMIDGCNEQSSVTINAPEGDPEPFEICLCKQHWDTLSPDLYKEFAVTNLDASTIRLDKSRH